ncbi:MULTISPECIES: DUF3370 domain-containing protein [unclassified Sphaerospermopsis]|uniref:DUF3370 domain-containing protein n=1 Tax=unclassified Sphaerospermopsis TaxID=2646443 RepID=UPI0016802217|nr:MULTISPECIES: DUF3370 domain-containing protein [unclassified Sphaerospermopsis]MBD2131225.1 DUF3370 domain-containing protein [Sphaerospermopsis sp. FACHB-1094]MBD2145025.1 DUF3370 domain-containing protein [Sphaerospermopsis sp. FACHB-1194]
MLSALLGLTLAQATPTAPPPEEVVIPQEVRALPGRLDTVPVFNSNSPELVLKEGILLSTFPSEDKKVPTAHLNFPFQGRFDVFSHHIARAEPPEDLRSLYHGIILHNPGTTPVTVNILQGASYLSQPDAPFLPLDSFIPNDAGNVFAGPGSRVMSDILRGRRQNIFPAQIVIPPGESQMLLNLPIPVRELTPPLNGRSTYMRLRSNGTVYAASLAMFAKTNADGSERVPTLAEWEDLLKNGDLSTPRDKTPTPIQGTGKPAIYGRVAGVSRGSQWRSLLTDNSNSRYLTIPQPGQAFSYALSSLHGGTFGTGQIQTAPMLVRYPDTAYFAHGNYGIQYSLRLPLLNNSQSAKNVTVSLQTPIKENELTKSGLRFFTTPARQVFFRGTVRVRYRDDQGKPATKFVHLVQKRGEPGQPLVSLNMKPGDNSWVEVDFLYPPDASPPQVLTVATQE